jgi:hypothetical protein
MSRRPRHNHSAAFNAKVALAAHWGDDEAGVGCRCQTRVLAGSRVRTHYLKHDYADETKQAWAKLRAAIEAVLGRHLRQVRRSS